MKLFMKILIGLAIVLILIQFIRIDKNNPESPLNEQFLTVENAPENVQLIMKRACFDCHSHNTTWPWYADVAPVSWFVGKHVREAREELNFSAWGTYSNKRRHHKMEECLEEVSEGEMPLEGYVVWHDEALISPTDTAILFSFFRKTMRRYKE